jgi:hypothetical protein
MDASSLAVIASIIIAVVAAVPTVLSLLAQNRKDKKQQQMDMTTAANAAAVSIIAPLQAELARSQARNIELELALIEKIKENGQLVQDGIDKDAAIRTQKYNMEIMQSRLDSYETMTSDPATKKENVRITKKGKDTGSIKEDTDIIVDEDKKQEVLTRIQQELDDIKTKSINGGTATEEIKQ